MSLVAPQPVRSSPLNHQGLLITTCLNCMNSASSYQRLQIPHSPTVFNQSKLQVYVRHLWALAQELLFFFKTLSSLFSVKEKKKKKLIPLFFFPFHCNRSRNHWTAREVPNPGIGWTCFCAMSGTHSHTPASFFVYELQRHYLLPSLL